MVLAGPTGRYRLDRLIASGGSAEVWRGFDTELGRPVAIKLLHAHLVPDETSRSRLEQEAKAAAALSHPGIVAVFDLVHIGDRPAIVLELVDGESLASRLAREGRLRPAEAASIAAGVADAIQHAHEHGVLHRDVKPGNILLEADGRPRLTDFGIARLLDAQRERLTAPDSIPGTLRYLAPESLTGAKVGPAADVYGVGVVLFEMLAGRPPYDAPNPIVLAEAQQQQPPALLPGVPGDLAAIAGAALRTDPGARTASAGEVADALRGWLRGGQPEEPIASPEPSDEATTVIATQGATDAGLATAAHSDRPGRARQWVARAVPLVVLAAAGIVVASLALSRGPAAPSPSPGSLAQAGSPTPLAPAAAAPSPTANGLDAAHARFSDVVVVGERQGDISEDGAKDLLDDADRVLERAAEGERRKIVEALNDLRRTIDELERDGEITAALAGRLRQVVESMAAAT